MAGANKIELHGLSATHEADCRAAFDEFTSANKASGWTLKVREQPTGPSMSRVNVEVFPPQDFDVSSNTLQELAMDWGLMDFKDEILKILHAVDRVKSKRP
jgi:hypothetical protein